MADLETGNPHGVVHPSGNNRSGSFINPNLASIERMKAALQDHSATLYTDEKLNTMTYNDLVYAVRTNDLTELPSEE